MFTCDADMLSVEDLHDMMRQYNDDGLFLYSNYYVCDRAGGVLDIGFTASPYEPLSEDMTEAEYMARIEALENACLEAAKSAISKKMSVAVCVKVNKTDGTGYEYTVNPWTLAECA
jgi:hypothetical protein